MIKMRSTASYWTGFAATGWSRAACQSMHAGQHKSANMQIRRKRDTRESRSVIMYRPTRETETRVPTNFADTPYLETDDAQRQGDKLRVMANHRQW